MSNELQQLRNLGPKSVAQLNMIGIFDAEDLHHRGAINTYIDLKQAFPPITLNFLYAITEALESRDWRVVGATRKSELITELENRLEIDRSFRLA